MKTVFELSKPGRKAYQFPECHLLAYEFDSKYLSENELELPEVDEVSLVRHYTELSNHAYGVDNGFYPLGSCTMKYNPKINEITAALPGFTNLHPLQKKRDIQGSLELMYRLQEALKQITGMGAMSLQPAAGAHGEYTGLKIIKKYHTDRGDLSRTKIIVPDSAHGTNPASSTLCGLQLVNIPSLEDGSVDLDALSAACGADTAGLMLTNPNTLGKFDKNITKISQIVHDAGGLLYYDGANMNAIMGVARPGDMGFDVVHLNLHKTFATPHGGGGPGAGPVGVCEKLASYLPSPHVTKDRSGTYSLSTPENTIGSVKAFYGNFNVLVKAYTYILVLGREGLRNASEMAVLNANYLKHLLKKYDYDKDSRCMHEFVLSMEKVHKETGVSALDIAKSMIDYGIHPPTMYFPNIVHEALMFEPTETETKETLEEVAAIIIEIIDRAYTNPEEVKNSPKAAYITRPDEVKAAREPKLKA
ncbi:MAG: aminomethyl-transferring glycine dehydrogenase subunit GcvPB [Clostridia bacterium]|nr:aminomethyl-transferring glycine dehydrogenase subunit GcvPB [Clostridia bacterium]